jgi:bifunctional pyridoxal-dependent enzyme with beta-cystathionase and maltose regulon repressor activities
MKVREVVKIIIEKKKCPVHAVGPTVDARTREISVTACCKAFQIACTEHANTILSVIDVSDFWKVA